MGVGRFAGHRRLPPHLPPPRQPSACRLRGPWLRRRRWHQRRSIRPTSPVGSVDVQFLGGNVILM